MLCRAGAAHLNIGSKMDKQQVEVQRTVMC